jgi:hypothetical protein
MMLILLKRQTTLHGQCGPTTDNSGEREYGAEENSLGLVLSWSKGDADSRRPISTCRDGRRGISCFGDTEMNAIMKTDTALRAER